MWPWIRYGTQFRLRLCKKDRWVGYWFIGRCNNVLKFHKSANPKLLRNSCLYHKGENLSLLVGAETRKWRCCLQLPYCCVYKYNGIYFHFIYYILSSWIESRLEESCQFIFFFLCSGNVRRHRPVHFIPSFFFMTSHIGGINHLFHSDKRHPIAQHKDNASLTVTLSLPFLNVDASSSILLFLFLGGPFCGDFSLWQKYGSGEGGVETVRYFCISSVAYWCLSFLSPLFLSLTLMYFFGFYLLLHINVSFMASGSQSHFSSRI